VPTFNLSTALERAIELLGPVNTDKIESMDAAFFVTNPKLMDDPKDVYDGDCVGSAVGAEVGLVVGMGVTAPGL